MSAFAAPMMSREPDSKIVTPQNNREPLMNAVTPRLVSVAPELEAIINFRQYNDWFASAGQPTSPQLNLLRTQGFERIVYIAFTDHKFSIADEDRQVKTLGMDYLQVPVDWDRPVPSEFYAVADYLQRGKGKKTLLHCQVNMRATAFSFLYRVIYEQVPIAQAKADMNSVWQPNQVWRDFIFQVLAEQGVDPEVDGCDWTPA